MLTGRLECDIIEMNREGDRDGDRWVDGKVQKQVLFFGNIGRF